MKSHDELITEMTKENIKNIICAYKMGLKKGKEIEHKKLLAKGKTCKKCKKEISSACGSFMFIREFCKGCAGDDEPIEHYCEDCANEETNWGKPKEEKEVK